MKLTKNIITSIMAHKDYSVCYEPIVELATMDIVGYEALSRFQYNAKPVTPDAFFKTIHQDLELFFYVESILKIHQVKNRPVGKKLFLNLDPDVAIVPNHIIYWVNFFSDKEDLVVEIIENSDEENMEGVEHFMDWMNEYKIEFAYDDYGKANSVFFDSLFHRANTIKLDMDFIKTIRTNRDYIEVAKGLALYTKSSNKSTVMEGIESEEDLKIAQEIGVDFVQGYLFRDEFIYKSKKKESKS